MVYKEKQFPFRLYMALLTCLFPNPTFVIPTEAALRGGVEGPRFFSGCFNPAWLNSNPQTGYYCRISTEPGYLINGSAGCAQHRWCNRLISTVMAMESTSVSDA